MLDKQFLFILLQNVFIGICSLIDTGFGNNIDLDSVCVLSAFTVITWATTNLCTIGSYAYRVVLDKGKTCIYINLAIAIILGAIVYLISPIVPHLYYLTDSQYMLFEQCLKIHAFSLPILAIGDFINSYVVLLCKNKISIIGNIILYAIMIVTDALVVHYNGTLVHIIECTLISWLIYDIYGIITSGIVKEKFKFNCNEIKNLLKHGVNICCSSFTAKIATIIFNIYASKLGTRDYSIHAVCYALGIFTENFTNALFTYETIVVAVKKKGLEKFQYCVAIAKKYAVFLVVFSYITSYAILVFTHGTISLRSCIPYAALYCTEIFVLLFYEPMRAYLTSEQQTKYLRYGGLFGFIVRLPIAIGGYYLGIGLTSFAIACTIDYGVRGLYMYKCSVKVKNQIENSL